MQQRDIVAYTLGLYACIIHTFLYSIRIISLYNCVYDLNNLLSISGIHGSASSLRATTSPANTPVVPYDSEFSVTLKN